MKHRGSQRVGPWMAAAVAVVLLAGVAQTSGVKEAQAAPSAWVETKSSKAHGGSMLVTETPWAGASFTMKGPKIALWYMSSVRGGRAAVLINGRRVKTLEMYNKRTARKVVLLKGTRGSNVVQVIALPDRHASSKGARVNVDAFGTSTKTCQRGCKKTPTAQRMAVSQVGDSGTWYPSAVPEQSSPEWNVAISSYVRGRDATPLDAARSVVRAAACEMGKKVPRGVIVLSFGKQVKIGANGFGKPITYQELAEITRSWAAGLAECGTGPWEVAVSTSNSGGVTAFNGYDGGVRWAQAVAAAAEGTDPRVVISGGVDLEPGWGPPGQARAWVDGYVASSARRLWNFGSADGCPQVFLSKLTCNNGWTVDDVIWVSSRAGSQVVAMPQLHTQSGSLARQWAVLAERSARTGEPMRIAAVGVQTAACAQVRGGCPTTGESAWNAWAKLRTLLDARSATRSMPLGAPRDIRWGWGGTFVVPQPTTTTTTAPSTTTTAPPTTTTTTTTAPAVPPRTTTTTTTTTTAPSTAPPTTTTTTTTTTTPPAPTSTSTTAAPAPPS